MGTDKRAREYSVFLKTDFKLTLIYFCWVLNTISDFYK
jgi:hypothetical protein